MHKMMKDYIDITYGLVYFFLYVSPNDVINFSRRD